MTTKPTRASWFRRIGDIAQATGGPHSDEAFELAPLDQFPPTAVASLFGAPARDPDFGCADLPLFLQLDDVVPRYRRRLLESPR